MHKRFGIFELAGHLRFCHEGEFGSIISRYHKIDGYDWIVMPLVPYLYAVDTPDQIPV